MRGSKKGASPQFLADWIANQNGINDTYDDFPNPEKSLLVSLLFEEQNHECVYCGRALKRSEYGRTSHVEHFKPKAAGRFPSLSLAFENLFLSCGPEVPDAASGPRCGVSKSDWFEQAEVVEPLWKVCRITYRYHHEGHISQRVASPNTTELLKRLRLNTKEAIVERSNFANEIEKEVLSDFATWPELKQQFTSNGPRPGYSHVFADVFL